MLFPFHLLFFYSFLFFCTAGQFSFSLFVCWSQKSFICLVIYDVDNSAFQMCILVSWSVDKDFGQKIPMQLLVFAFIELLSHNLSSFAFSNFFYFEVKTKFTCSLSFMRFQVSSFSFILGRSLLAGCTAENRMCGIIFTVTYCICVFQSDTSDCSKQKLSHTHLGRPLHRKFFQTCPHFRVGPTLQQYNVINRLHFCRLYHRCPPTPPLAGS